MPRHPPPLPLVSADTLLRRAGFRIESRPNNQSAQWRRDGSVLCEETALKLSLAEAARQSRERDIGGEA